MGIRYYAYAFDADRTEQAMADPQSLLSDDPLADAWGMEPGVVIGHATFEQRSSKRDLLYLDKAWPHLQHILAPDAQDAEPRPAFRMVEGQVRMQGLGWDPWVRALTPEQVKTVDADLRTVSDADAATAIRAGFAGHRDVEDEVRYALDFLARARSFVAELAADGRGMVYLIG